MSAPSNIPIEDKYKGQSTEDLLMQDDPIPGEPQAPAQVPAKTEPDIDLIEPGPAKLDQEDLLAEGKTKPPIKEPDEEIDDKEPVFPVPKKVILAKYPDLFKDFKFLERAMYRDKEFTELVGTPEDARELVAAKQQLDNIQTDVLGGKIDDLMNEVKQVDQNAFYRLVDNFLPAVQKIDQVAYLTVITNIGKLIISDMYNNAKKNGNAENEQAAIALHQYLFPGMDYQPPQRLAKDEPKPDERQVQQQQAWAEQQYNGALSGLITRVDNTLKATITEHIDPNGQMSAYEKRGAIQDTLNAIHDQLASDGYFRPYHDRLWKQYTESGFDPAKGELIRKNYLSRARVMLRDTMGKVRSNVLGKKANDRPDKDRQGPITPGRNASGQPSRGSTPQGQSAVEKARQIPKGMTTREYLDLEE